MCLYRSVRDVAPTLQQTPNIAPQIHGRKIFHTWEQCEKMIVEHKLGEWGCCFRSLLCFFSVCVVARLDLVTLSSPLRSSLFSPPPLVLFLFLFLSLHFAFSRSTSVRSHPLFIPREHTNVQAMDHCVWNRDGHFGACQTCSPICRNPDRTLNLYQFCVGTLLVSSTKKKGLTVSRAAVFTPSWSFTLTRTRTRTPFISNTLAPSSAPGAFLLAFSFACGRATTASLYSMLIKSKNQGSMTSFLVVGGSFARIAVPFFAVFLYNVLGKHTFGVMFALAALYAMCSSVERWCVYYLFLFLFGFLLVFFLVAVALTLPHRFAQPLSFPLTHSHTAPPQIRRFGIVPCCVLPPLGSEAL